jgi:glutaminase
VSTPTRVVSSGSLPGQTTVRRVVEETHTRFASERSGSLSQVYPALAEADPDAFGPAVVSVSGDHVLAGDACTSFTVMSVAKPFVFALVAQSVADRRPVDGIEHADDQDRDQQGEH